MRSFPLELLSPAKNIEIAEAAVTHGADAVYIGASAFGARKSASNNLDDIAKIVDFAHRFRSKIYVTVNTIVYENEIKKVEQLCRDLYHLNVDALIVQDMGLLRMNLPPIALHASTQCDIRTPEKAEFLEKVGFSQLVLARELSITEIKEVVDAVSIPVETFIHGALCVSYSGRCHASFFHNKRSANRGECAQLCRLPYNLVDSKGKEIVSNKYLLSMRDFNASRYLDKLIEIGVSSFKIEGRLKDLDYVKNVTAFYNEKIDNILKKPEFSNLKRSSYGESVPIFSPKLDKSFNRGFTTYRLSGSVQQNQASINTSKSLGEKVENLAVLNNGDGVSFFDKNGQYTGAYVNKICEDKIYFNRPVNIPKDATLFRTFDNKWQKALAGNTAERKIKISLSLDYNSVEAKDEMGNLVRIPLEFKIEKSSKEMDYEKAFSKLGVTIFKLEKFENKIGKYSFIPLSRISILRKRIVSELLLLNRINYPYSYRRKEDFSVKYPIATLTFLDNVSNSYARKFYKEHGIEKIEEAMEVGDVKGRKGKVLMTSRYCILKQLGMCKKIKATQLNEPLYIINSNKRFRLNFNCSSCEMELLS